MALFVALTVVKSEQSAGTTSIGIPTNGNGGIVFEAIPSTSVGGITALSKITIPASGLNQKAKEYYSSSTVAALVALMV